MHSLFAKLNQRRHQGQSLVEFTLTIPFIIMMLFGMVEMSRVWQSWHGAKLAADDGCYTAAVNNDSGRGRSVMQARAAKAKLNLLSSTVTAIKNELGTVDVGYECSISVRYEPLLGSMSVPVLGGGDIPIFNGGFTMNYNNDYYRSVF